MRFDTFSSICCHMRSERGFHRQVMRSQLKVEELGNKYKPVHVYLVCEAFQNRVRCPSLALGIHRGHVEKAQILKINSLLCNFYAESSRRTR